LIVTENLPKCKPIEFEIIKIIKNMYIKELRIKGYRSIKDLKLNFNEGVNVLIGKNNTGKTSIIDALRLCLSSFNWLDNRNGVRFDIDKDFYIDTESQNDYYKKETLFTLIFDLPNFEKLATKHQRKELGKIKKDDKKDKFKETILFDHKASYLQIGKLLENGKIEFRINIRFYIDTINEKRKLKKEVWFGDDKTNRISSHFWELLRVIYLRPLRDAISELRPPSKKIGEYFDLLCPKNNEKKELAKSIKETFKNNQEWFDLREKGCKCIKKSLGDLSINEKQGELLIEFLPFDFKKIVSSLNMQIQKNSNFFDLEQNGLGFNNLIYTATVLATLDIDKDSEKDESFFLLIEEPEAHLHPQSQNQFFEHLNSLSNRGYQVFITSHSPTLTAKSDLDNLIVLQELNNKIKACHISKFDLKPKTKTFLRKFLDVTKSQLFFSEGVLFVEGTTEALLMQKFSEIMDKREDKKNLYNLTKNGIEIVNVGGVSFEHFQQLFGKENSLISKYSIITDGDQNKNNNEEAVRIEKLKKRVDKNIGRLEIAENNFEYEIYNLDKNREIINNCWREIRIKVGDEEISEFEEASDSALKFQEKVDRTKSKTALALKLLDSLEDSLDDFEIPEYCQRAIKHFALKTKQLNEIKSTAKENC
jgi:putative ATP-dependent endonuclease of OLD family